MTITAINGHSNAPTATIHTRRQTMSRLLPEGSAGAVSHWLPTRWPRVGGDKLLPLAPDAFTAPDFADAYVPGTFTAIYAAGCGYDHANRGAVGLVGVARQAMAALHKVSTTTQTDLRSRARELNADRYGALTTSEDGYPCSNLGFDGWMMQHILPKGAPLEGSPVTVGERCLSVRLPHDMLPREFDKQLAAMMDNAQLNRWLETHAGQAHCRHLGIAPAQLARATTYRFNGAMRRSSEAEIYFFRPKSFDADRLLRLAEVTVHNHVTTPPDLRATASWRSNAQGTRSDFEAST